MESEMAQAKRIASDPRNPKSVKEAALGRLRVLERAAGIPSVNYNSSAFSG